MAGYTETYAAFRATLEAAEEDGTIGPLARQALKRPSDYGTLSLDEQREIDRRLGILEWGGEPTS